MNDNHNKVAELPIGTHFQVRDSNSTDAGKVFVRIQGGVVDKSDLRDCSNWEEIQVLA